MNKVDEAMYVRKNQIEINIAQLQSRSNRPHRSSHPYRITLVTATVAVVLAAVHKCKTNALNRNHISELRCATMTVPSWSIIIYYDASF